MASNAETVDVAVKTELETKGGAIVARAQSLVVYGENEFRQAGEVLREAKAYDKQGEALFKPAKQSLDRAKKELLDLERRVRGPFQLVESIIRPKLAGYEAEQRRKREEAARRAQEELRRQEEERRLAEAARMEEEGHSDEAMAFLDAPVSTPTVVPEPATPKVEGLSFRDSWKARVVDRRQLIAFVAANPDFDNLLIENEPALNAMARAQREGFNIPGVQAVCDRVTVTR